MSVKKYCFLNNERPCDLTCKAAFEVDEIDYFTRTGWSVVLRGAVETVESDDLPAPEARPTPWWFASRSTGSAASVRGSTMQQLCGRRQSSTDVCARCHLVEASRNRASISFGVEQTDLGDRTGRLDQRGLPV